MKTLTSPVKKWPGTIVLPDYLNMTQAIAWEDAIADARSLLPDIEFEYTEDNKIDTTKLTPEHFKYLSVSQSLKYAEKMLPGILACVSEWNLEGLDAQNFPATPRQARIDLFIWLISEITKLYIDADEVPNE
jgi:hypothetical protein